MVTPRVAWAFCAGAFLATLAPFAGVLVGALLHERGLRSAWAGEIDEDYAADVLAKYESA